MILDLLALILFPALMAFAAASDLLTMTISNRIAIILVGGFLALAIAGGMAPMQIPVSYTHLTLPTILLV